MIFSFDPADVKSISNENLDKPLEHSPISHQRPISSTEIILQRALGERDPERRYSAPPGEGKPRRDSMGSMDYLLEGPGEEEDKGGERRREEEGGEGGEGERGREREKGGGKERGRRRGGGRRGGREGEREEERE